MEGNVLYFPKNKMEKTYNFINTSGVVFQIRLRCVITHIYIYYIFINEVLHMNLIEKPHLIYLWNYIKFCANKIPPSVPEGDWRGRY